MQPLVEKNSERCLGIKQFASQTVYRSHPGRALKKAIKKSVWPNNQAPRSPKKNMVLTPVVRLGEWEELGKLNNHTATTNNSKKPDRYNVISFNAGMLVTNNRIHLKNETTFPARQIYLFCATVSYLLSGKIIPHQFH